MIALGMGVISMLSDTVAVEYIHACHLFNENLYCFSTKQTSINPTMVLDEVHLLFLTGKIPKHQGFISYNRPWDKYL